MILPDVNVLVYAFRSDAPNHQAYYNWLDGVLNDDQAFGLSDLVLSGFLRVVTHPRIFNPPTPLDAALEFIETLQFQPHAVNIKPGPGHWAIFEKLCRATRTQGNAIPDAFHAALAIESGSEWITTDKDFARFAGLRWRHPLE